MVTSDKHLSCYRLTPNPLERIAGLGYRHQFGADPFALMLGGDHESLTVSMSYVPVSYERRDDAVLISHVVNAV